MSGLETSPKRKKREAAKRRAQEAAWKSKSGPVEIYVDPEIAARLRKSRLDLPAG